MAYMVEKTDSGRVFELWNMTRGQDCGVRALANATGLAYAEAFARLYGSKLIGRRICNARTSFNGLRFRLVSRFRAWWRGYRPTVSEFAELHPSGVYILRCQHSPGCKTAHHYVCIRDGVAYDIANPGYLRVSDVYKGVPA